MGWNDSHLHSFKHGDLLYEAQNLEYWTERHRDQENVQISHLLIKPGDTLLYHYDFGDDWEHEVTLLSAFPAEKNQGLPRCLEGENACPPEDVGGARAD